MDARDRKELIAQLSLIEGMDEFLLHELRKTRKASCEAVMADMKNKACGLAHVANWLEQFSSDLNINLKDDD